MKYAIKKERIYKVWIVILLLYFNFPFYLKPLVSLQQLLLWGGCLWYVFVNIKTVLKGKLVYNLRNDCARTFLYLYWIFVIFVLLVPFLHRTNDYAYYKRIIYFTIRLVQYTAIFIYITKKIKQNRIVTYMNSFVTACSIYVIISTFMLINPQFKEIWKTILYSTESNERIAGELMYITRFGLAGFSGFPCTFMCATAVIFSLYLILQKYNQTSHFIKMIINILGTFFYGRIGMLCSFICISLFIGYYIIKKKNIKMLVICGIIGMIIFFILLYLYYTNPIVTSWINWAFGPFRNWINTGKFGTASSDTVLYDMYWMPESATLFFGDGRYMDNGAYYMHTDAGFMRLMLYSGVFVQSLLYFSVLSLLISTACSLKNLSKTGYIILFLLLGFEFLFFEFKGEMFFNFLAVLLPLALCNVEQIDHLHFSRMEFRSLARIDK